MMYICICIYMINWQLGKDWQSHNRFRVWVLLLSWVIWLDQQSIVQLCLVWFNMFDFIGFRWEGLFWEVRFDRFRCKFGWCGSVCKACLACLASFVKQWFGMFGKAGQTFFINQSHIIRVSKAYSVSDGQGVIKTWIK